MFVLILCLVYPMLPVCLDCQFVIAPSVFSNVYQLHVHVLVYMYARARPLLFYFDNISRDFHFSD